MRCAFFWIDVPPKPRTLRCSIVTGARVHGAPTLFELRYVRPTSAFLPPTYLHPCSRFPTLRSKGGTLSRCPFPTLAGRSATRAVLSRKPSVARPLTTSPRAPRHPRRFFQRHRSRSFPTCPVKERALPRSEMLSFGGRWSAAPPRRTREVSPSACAQEPSANGRRSQWVLPPWSDETPPFARRSATPRLATKRGFSCELVPARVLSAACLTDDRRKRHFCEPRRSDRILQHDKTHGHDLIRATAPLPIGARCPKLCEVATFRSRSLESRVLLRNHLAAPSRARPPCALLHGSAL